MDISSIGTSPTSAYPSSSAIPKTAMPSFGDARSMTDSMLVAQLPAASLPGLGGNLDIYDIVGKQSQGLLAGGRTALEIANISLGKDMSQAANSSAGNATGAANTATQPPTTSTTPTTNASTHTNTALNDILKTDGYIAPPSDPYVFQKDFFAN